MHDRIYADILQHLHMCLNLVKLFKGREEIIHRVTEYLKGSNNIPLIMYGESGCGKTSLLAKSASLVREVYNDATPVLLIRFLGTSPDSSTIQPLLHSLCVQISYLYDQPIEDIPSDLVLLQGYFKKLLSCATKESPMVIFLDSLDQISPTDGAHSLMWLPTRLPPNVKFVVSSLPKLYGVLDTLFKLISNKGNRIEITPLGADLGGNIIKTWLERKQRDVSSSQWEIVNAAISKCNLPLYVKLVFDEICRWRSFSKPQDTVLSHSIHEIINKLFERIENSHGKTLVSRA
ncbi:hypothetical protein EB796_011001 [Bugula neritina]|uniref:NACHT domain-containing protein n=1 Tax=Bugula neritina TaxID=10212 RepID=A0A7J7JWD9_BUGNE|nr:hypothetical protein EB796_011001 [Bugula neritina]